MKQGWHILKSYQLSERKYKPILKDLIMLEREAHNFIKVRDYAIEYLKQYDDKKIWQILAINTSKDLKDYKRAEEYFGHAFFLNRQGFTGTSF